MKRTILKLTPTKHQYVGNLPNLTSLIKPSSNFSQKVQYLRFYCTCIPSNYLYTSIFGGILYIYFR
jgi:hypothetical protein